MRTLFADEDNESCIPMLDIEGNGLVPPVTAVRDDRGPADGDIRTALLVGVSSGNAHDAEGPQPMSDSSASPHRRRSDARHRDILAVEGKDAPVPGP